MKLYCGGQSLNTVYSTIIFPFPFFNQPFFFPVIPFLELDLSKIFKNFLETLIGVRKNISIFPKQLLNYKSSSSQFLCRMWPIFRIDNGSPYSLQNKKTFRYIENGRISINTQRRENQRHRWIQRHEITKIG